MDITLDIRGLLEASREFVAAWEEQWSGRAPSDLARERLSTALGRLLREGHIAAAVIEHGGVAGGRVDA